MRTHREAPFASFEVQIDKVVYGGFGLGRHQGRVVFVPFTVPGDRAQVQVVQQKKNFLRASIIEILEPGPGRQIPPCPHFGSCGGCQWQHLEYTQQVEMKRQILEEIFHHRFPETRELRISMKGSPEFFGYRSRARIQLRGFGESSKIGFFQFQSHHVEDVESCPLFRPKLNQALASVREARRQGTDDPGTKQLELACSDEDGAWAAAVPDLEEGRSAMEETDSRMEDVILRRKVGGFTYLISPSVFFQANDCLLDELVGRIRDLARGTKAAAAVDLFSGVGLFTLPLSRQFEKLVAVENSALASRLCAKNASESGMGNIETVCANAAAWMQAIGSVSAPSFDLVLLDPPRSGAGPAVMERLIEWAPEIILYVSCDPHTLVRDVALLPSQDYRIDCVEGLDLFPQTYHFETIVRLRRRVVLSPGAHG